jgi:mRNA interferase MazF
LNPRRGEVWLVDFGEPIGHEPASIRPAVIVSADEANAGPGMLVAVVPTTTRDRRLPLHVPVESGGLTDPSFARCDQVRSVSEHRLVHSLGTLDAVELFAIDRVLRLFLDL